MIKILIISCLLFNIFCLIISPIICIFLIIFAPYLFISVKCDQISFYFIKYLVEGLNEGKKNYGPNAMFLFSFEKVYKKI